MANYGGIGAGLERLSNYFMDQAYRKDEDKRALAAEAAREEREKRRVTKRSAAYEGSSDQGPPALLEDKYNSEGELIGTDVASGAKGALFAEARKAGILGAEAEAEKQKKADDRYSDKYDLDRRKVAAQEKRAAAADKKADRPLLSAKPRQERAEKKPNPFEAQKLYQKTVEEAKRAGVPADEYARSVGVDLAELQTWIHPDGFGGGGSSIRGGARKPNKDPLNLVN